MIGSACPLKKESHNQPARSLLGQSVNKSTAFCLKVLIAASKTRFIFSFSNSYLIFTSLFSYFIKLKL